MIKAEWTSNDALSTEQTTHSNAPNALNVMNCVSRKERVMKNADKFKEVFGIYASEVWAKSEREFLEWLNEDVPERNVGKWIERAGMLMCSECGDAWGTQQFDEVMSFNYCPNCGAKMKGEHE